MKWMMSAAVLALLSGAALAGENVTYRVGGQEYEGYLAKTAGTAAGLVLIVHDWDGQDAYENRRADMLAGLGYNAFALDLFGKGVRPADIAGRRAAMGELYGNREKMRSLMLGGLAAARRQVDGDAVVIGYCFGGAGVLELARSGAAERVNGYVTFHGDVRTPEGQSYPSDTPPILIEHGGADTSVKMSTVSDLMEKLEHAGVTYEVQVYSGTPHAFTVPGNLYRETADRESWEALTEFLKDNL